MKASIFLTALILSTPLLVFSEGCAPNVEMSSFLSGKIAYLEANYQKAFEYLSQGSLLTFNNKTYWQLCHSALMAGKTQDFLQKMEEMDYGDQALWARYREFWQAYQGKPPFNDRSADQISNIEWEMMFHCIPREEKLEYLDRLYTHRWLQYPSVRSFMLEKLIEWGLNEDAYELASLDFKRINTQWIEVCDQYFTHEQLKIIFQRTLDPDCEEALQKKWYEQAIALHSGHSGQIEHYAHAISTATLSQETVFHLARCFIRHGQSECAQVLVEKSSLSTEHQICLRIEHALRKRELDLVDTLLTQTALSQSEQSFYRAQMAYYNKNFTQAWRLCQNIAPQYQNKEFHVLQACILAHTHPEKTMPFVMNLYRNKSISHREITIVQIHMLSLQGNLDQANKIWTLLQRQEKTPLKNISIFLNQDFLKSLGKR